MRRVGDRVRLAALLVAGALREAVVRLDRRIHDLRSARRKGYPYYRHTLSVRVMHWCNVVFLTILLGSGLAIFNVHPALYWGKSSYQGVPPTAEIGGRGNGNGRIIGVTRVLGHDFDTTGFLGVSRGPAGQMVMRAFPYWMTIPENQWLAMARRWHFFFAWLLVVNGTAFLAYSLASGHVRRDLIPTGDDWRSIGRSIIDHLRFRFHKGEAARHYNVLQKLAYLSVIFFLLPLMVLMGLGMSPALDALYPGWVDLFFGRQSVRTIHFTVAWAILSFAMIHVFLVVVSGFWNNIRSMITGYYRIVTPEGKHG